MITFRFWTVIRLLSFRIVYIGAPNDFFLISSIIWRVESYLVTTWWLHNEFTMCTLASRRLCEQFLFRREKDDRIDLLTSRAFAPHKTTLHEPCLNSSRVIEFLRIETRRNAVDWSYTHYNVQKSMEEEISIRVWNWYFNSGMHTREWSCLLLCIPF